MNTIPNITYDSSVRNQASTLGDQSSIPNKEKFYIQNDQKQLTNDIRLINLESRVETLEKMLHFYEELLKLKEEEKNNSEQFDMHKITDLTSKVSQLECNMTSLNKKLNDQYSFLIERTDSLQLERTIGNVDDNKETNIEDQLIKSTSNYASSCIMNTSKHNDYIINRIDQLEEIIQKNKKLNNNKLSFIQTQFDNKITDILSVIQDLNRITESNEYTVAELKQTTQILQEDHTEFMKRVSIQNDRGKQIDYILEQINDLKCKSANIFHLDKTYLQKDNIEYEDYLYDN